VLSIIVYEINKSCFVRTWHFRHPFIAIYGISFRHSAYARRSLFDYPQFLRDRLYIYYRQGESETRFLSRFNDTLISRSNSSISSGCGQWLIKALVSSLGSLITVWFLSVSWRLIKRRIERVSIRWSNSTLSITRWYNSARERSTSFKLGF